MTFDIPINDPYYNYYIKGANNFIGEIKSGEEFQFKVIGYDFDKQPITYQYNNLPLGLTGDPITGWVTGTPVLTQRGINKFFFSVKVLKPVAPRIVFTYLIDSTYVSNPSEELLLDKYARFNNLDLSKATELYLKNVDNEIVSIDPLVKGKNISTIMDLVYENVKYVKVAVNSEHYTLFEINKQPSVVGSWYRIPIRYVFGSKSYPQDSELSVLLGERIISATESFSFNIVNDVEPTITWISPENLGTISNGTTSMFYVKASSSEELTYRVAAENPDGTNSVLPPNLLLLPTGEIYGKASFQPNTYLMTLSESANFQFTVEAYSKAYPLLSSKKTFNITIKQEIENPVDTLYFKASPNLSDRKILDSLLKNEEIIPTSALYRPNDMYFGKSKEVVFPFAYGMSSSSLEEYITAVGKNHYKKRIILGELRTAQARNENNEVVYEVVYSIIIDDQMNQNNQSINKTIFWPTLIYSASPWFSSNTKVYSSYGQTSNTTYHTALTANSIRGLNPNSFDNMLEQVKTYIPQNSSSKLLPLWMTSQQSNGSTLGFLKAWVICYTKPNYSEIIKNNIETLWQYTLNQINFEVDRYTIDKSNTYNYDTDLYFPTWTDLPSASPVPDPINSNDIYVLFPQQNILPN